MKIISDTISEIRHELIDEKVKHVIYRTLEVTDGNIPENVFYDGYHWIKSESRKIRHGEFDGYYSGRLYIYTFMKILD
jgi:hypothetical protein